MNYTNELISGTSAKTPPFLHKYVLSLKMPALRNAFLRSKPAEETDTGALRSFKEIHVVLKQPKESLKQTTSSHFLSGTKISRACKLKRKVH